MVEIHKCSNCKKQFSRSSVLTKHLLKKNPCKFVKGDSDFVKGDSDDEDEIIDSEIMSVKIPDLPTFDFKKIDPEDNYSISIIGIRRCGKSTLIKHIYPLMDAIHDATFFISNSSDAPIYEFVRKNMFSQHNDQMIKDIFKYQRRTKLANSILLIFDDCISYKTKNSEGAMQAYTRGRNRNISIIQSSQYMQLISRVSRTNSDLIIIGNNPGELKKFIVDNLLFHKILLPKSIKIRTKTNRILYVTRFLEKFTNNYMFLIINNIDKKLYKFKVPM